MDFVETGRLKWKRERLGEKEKVMMILLREMDRFMCFKEIRDEFNLLEEETKTQQMNSSFTHSQSLDRQ